METTPLPIAPLLAFVACVLAHAAALRFFPRWGLLDFPERYGLARARLPYPTGILAAGLFAVFLASRSSSMQEYGLLVGIVALSATCFVDDRRRISPHIRLAVQIAVALVVFATGTRIYTLTNPLESFGLDAFLKLDAWTIVVPGMGPLPVLSGLFTVAWLTVTINALNWFDGIPGQTSAVSTVGFLTIGLLSASARVDQPSLALLCFVLAGLAAGSAAFELPAPLRRVVPGDSGAMFFGLMLGVLTIYAGGKVATGFLVLGVPLIDSALVVAQRVMAGRSPVKGSSAGEHLHHKLLAIGWSPWAIIALSVGLGSAFGISALFLSTFEKFIAAACLACVIAGMSAWSGSYGKTTKR